MLASRSIPAFAVLSFSFVASPGQGTRIADEGSFTITVAGRTAGRENFRISTVTRGNASEFLAKADAAFGDRKISPELRTDANGGVIEYVVTRTGEGAENWAGVIARGRLSATITTARGPSARELMVSAGSAILDDDLVHQHYFLAKRTHNGRVPVIIPRRNAQSAVRVTTVGPEPLQVGTREISATRLRIEANGIESRDIWVDDENRVLKLEIASRRLVATRDDPPRD